MDWTDVGEQSLLEIGRFIAAQNQSLELALKVVKRVESKCRLVADFPRVGIARGDLSSGVRSFRVDGLLVVYRPLDDGIRILLVAHGHQDLPALFADVFGMT